ncbi:hypothetical protein DCM91_01450 [Chitinophaga costaii]|nr:hypothetical protein DCM91_01450 [Chitinophaga costaii]
MNSLTLICFFLHQQKESPRGSGIQLPAQAGLPQKMIDDTREAHPPAPSKGDLMQLSHHSGFESLAGNKRMVCENFQ